MILHALWAWICYQVNLELYFVSPKEAAWAFDHACPDSEELNAFIASDFFKKYAPLAQRIRPKVSPEHITCLSSKRGSRRIATRRVTNPPKQNALLRVKIPGLKSFYIPTPEYFYALMAYGRDTAFLTLLADQLCSCYYHVPENGFIGRRQRPITSLKRIERLVPQLINKGKKSALEALNYACDWMESPMETTLSAFLFLPVRCGGCGFSRAKTNPEIILPQNVHSLVRGKRRLRPDFFFEKERVIVEYDSAQFHEGQSKAAQDKERAAAFQKLGYTVFSVTAYMIKNRAARLQTFEAIGSLIKEDYAPTKAWIAQHKLLESLAFFSEAA